MQTLNQNVLAALKGISKKDLQFTQKVIRRAITKKVSLEEAAKIEQFTPGTPVNFLVRGQIYQGRVAKINPVKIKVVDKKTKREFSVVPDAVQPVQRITRQRKSDDEHKKAVADKKASGRGTSTRKQKETVQ
jgi:hypothetical protein